METDALMKRRAGRWLMLVTLLVWQLGLVSSWHGTALAAIPAGVAHPAAAHCADHPVHAAMPAGAAHADSHHDAPAKNKPECCGGDGCRCGGVPAALLPGDASLGGVAADHPAPASAPDAARLSYRSSDPFRPPI